MSGRARRRRRKKEEEGEEEKTGKRKRGAESGERECRAEGKRRRVRATGAGKPYACTECNYRAARKSNLTRHMKCKHKTTPTAINTRKIRRCAEPFTLFEIKEFKTLEESLRSLHRRV